MSSIKCLSSQHEQELIGSLATSDLLYCLQGDHLLLSNCCHLATSLAVPQWALDSLGLAIHIQVPSAVRNGHKGVIRGTAGELPLLLRCLDIAKGIEGGHMFDRTDTRLRGVSRGLPYNSINIMSQANGR